jgi:hydrogenase maturation protein HypF
MVSARAIRVRGGVQGVGFTAAMPTTRVSPDLAICDDCLQELCDPSDRRFGYPYTNCTNCGPRYSVIIALPYDRSRTTMREWPMCEACAAEYDDPTDRRFHAEPIACAACGPQYALEVDGHVLEVRDPIAATVAYLRAGQIVGVKGIGGFHLACDAANADAVTALRTRKVRREKPFALMVRDIVTARRLATLSPAIEDLLMSAARPIVLVAARDAWPNVAPETGEIGLMLPYAPLHQLLFRAGAPDVLVMTSGNRSSEPIAYRDADARRSLTGLVDVMLVGERQIVRRLDDSIVRDSACGPVILRRSRGCSPGVVTTMPATQPILALGADRKNAITLVVAGQAIVSQHIGDLEYHDARMAFTETIHDLQAMYQVPWRDLRLAHDRHPDYASTRQAARESARERCAVQHHRAHIASVLAERGAWDQRVVGLALDGTGYGDDGTMWGCEFFVGSVSGGFVREAHLRPAGLVGGDSAARRPVQAAAGFLHQLDDAVDYASPPFGFGDDFSRSIALLAHGARVFQTTSMGRLFDAAAALVGFTRPISYEGQAAMWLEQLARPAAAGEVFPFAIDRHELDFRPLLSAVVQARRRRWDPRRIARAFHEGVASGVAAMAARLCETHRLDTVVCSGGVWQNDLLLAGVRDRLTARGLDIWTNHTVPPNDGGISLGQAAIAAFAPATEVNHA